MRLRPANGQAATAADCVPRPSKVVCRNHPPVDLRADFDQQPIARLAEIHRATLDPDFQSFLARVPTLADPMRR